MKTFDLAVIGGGPAGLSAAIEGARRGLSVALIDENRELGGKVLRPGNSVPSDGPVEKIEAKFGGRLFHSFRQVAGKIKVYLDTEVWAVHSDKVLEIYSSEDGSPKNRQIKAQILVVSVGAMERAIPFPGWTLPGVFTVGGLNALVKKAIVPGSAFVVAGSGPLLFVLTHHLIQAGATIKALVDTAGWFDQVKLAFHALTSAGFGKLLQATVFMSEIKRSGIPIYRSHIVVEADGDSGGVKKAVITRVDKDGHPVAGSQKQLPIDGLAVGYGLVPCLELTRLCGCEHYYDARADCWCVRKNETMQTSIPGILAAGDMAAIKGYEAAMDEGKLAGITAWTMLRRVKKPDDRRDVRLLVNKIRRTERFANAMSMISAPKPGLLDSLCDDTIICRCEDVAFKDIQAAVAAGGTDVNDVKRRTRCGMGHCQGRFCGQFINEIIWKLNGIQFKRGIFTTRMPVKPIPLEALASMENGGQDYGTTTNNHADVQ